jgi:FkbM family methyltransferase
LQRGPPRRRRSWVPAFREAAAASLATLGDHACSQSGEDVALHAQFFAGIERPGVFVEMGALDGLTFSNTAGLERELGWSGVLIEANPMLCGHLLRNRPHARTLCTAVSSNYDVLEFEKGMYTATFGEVAEMDSNHRKFHGGISKKVRVPSAPLGQLLRMVGVASIDLFSLDVEGAELKVLRTFDWSIPVRVWCIEVTDERRPAIDALLTSNGYEHTPWRACDGNYSKYGIACGGNYSYYGSDLWVRRGVWAPEAVAWRQYAKEPVAVR